jgi:hypothetical protein
MHVDFKHNQNVTKTKNMDLQDQLKTFSQITTTS